MNASRVTHQLAGLLFILSTIFFVLGSPPAAYAVNTEEVIVVESQVVCSPGAHKTCLPGPFTDTVEVPEGATGGQVDAYWLWWGTPGQVQPNEHSWFHLAVNGSHVDSVYCPDFGDVIPGEHFCGSVSFQAEAGDELALTIVHADEERGRTPGSHQQRWYITWSIPQVTPPAPIVTDTPTATPTVEETPPPAVTPTAETPTPTATITEMPAVTPTPDDAATPAATPEEPEPTDTPAVPAPTTIATLPPPQPPAGTQPAQIIPITGGDLALRDAQVGLFLRVLGGAGLAIVGLALVVMGIRRKYG